MRSRTRLTLGIIALLAVEIVQAAVVPGRWEKVGALRQGSEIVVHLRAGERIEGIFRGLDAKDLTLWSNESGDIRLERSQVGRVERLLRDDNTNGTLVGLGVGLGFGLVCGAIVDRSDVTIGPLRIEDHGAASLLGGLAGSGIGALIGYLADRSQNRSEVLYQAR
jgi:hypothetical protein